MCYVSKFSFLTWALCCRTSVCGTCRLLFYFWIQWIIIIMWCVRCSQSLKLSFPIMSHRAPDASLWCEQDLLVERKTSQCFPESLLGSQDTEVSCLFQWSCFPATITDDWCIMHQIWIKNRYKQGTERWRKRGEKFTYNYSKRKTYRRYVVGESRVLQVGPGLVVLGNIARDRDRVVN